MACCWPAARDWTSSVCSAWRLSRHSAVAAARRAARSHTRCSGSSRPTFRSSFSAWRWQPPCCAAGRTGPSDSVRWLYVPDALGLGLFSIVGVNYAWRPGTSLFVATLFGVITGSFGGVIGDIVCNEVPSLFCAGTPLYATCSFLGCWLYLGIEWRRRAGGRGHVAGDSVHCGPAAVAVR